MLLLHLSDVDEASWAGAFAAALAPYPVVRRGDDFDPAELADPLADENVEKNCGRGIFYMRRFVDRLSFTFPRCGGVIVRLGKRLPGSMPEPVAVENPPAVQQKAHRRP